MIKTMDVFFYENLSLAKKRFLLNLVFILSIQFHFVNVFSQNTPNYLPSHIACFSATLAGGKVYVNWTVMGETRSGIYVIERSTDGRHFTSVGLKHGVGSPIELLYSWIDESPVQENSIYRLRWIEKSKEEDIKSTSFL
jgi:hypothetical protein